MFKKFILSFLVLITLSFSVLSYAEPISNDNSEDEMEMGEVLNDRDEFLPDAENDEILVLLDGASGDDFNLWELAMVGADNIIQHYTSKFGENFSILTGNNFEILDDINSSIWVMGNEIISRNSINGQTMFMGRTVTISGEIEYGFIMAEVVNIEGEIQKDVVILADTVNIKNDSYIARDAFIIANVVNINSDIGRTLSVVASELNIFNGGIWGDVKADINKIYINEGARIDGDLMYRITQKPVIPGGVVTGNITEVIREERVTRSKTFSEVMSEIMYSYIAIVIMFFLVYALNKDYFGNLYEYIKGLDLTKKLLLPFNGALKLIGLPIFIIVLMITIVLVPISFIILFAYIIMLYFSYVVTGAMIGYFIKSNVEKNAKEISPVMPVLIGLAIVTAITKVAYVGGWISLIIMLFGLGTMRFNFKNRSI